MAIKHQRRIIDVEKREGGSLVIINDLRKKLARAPISSPDYQKYLRRKADRIMTECKMLADTSGWREGQQNEPKQWCNLYTEGLIHAIGLANKAEGPLLWRIIFEEHKVDGKLMP
jgi:hypothetical protein